MDKYRVAIVIPALNESLTIGSIVKEVGMYGVPIVVDDGSIDGTGILAKNSGAIVVRNEVSQGYDAALNSGFKKAAQLGAKIIITLDGDGQHNPLLLRKFINAISAGADIAIGIRSYRQRFAEHFFAWYTELCFGVSDPLCGMKAYKIELYESLGHFDSYRSIGTELTMFAIKKKFKITQVEFEVNERVGESKFGKIFSANYKIIRAMILSFRLVK